MDLEKNQFFNSRWINKEIIIYIRDFLKFKMPNMELFNIFDVQVFLILWVLFSSEYVHHKALEAGFGGRIFYRTVLNEIITLYAQLAFIVQIILIIRISSNLNFSILQGIGVYFLGIIVYIIGGVLIRGFLGRVLGVTLSFVSLFIIPYLIYKIW